MPSRRIGNQEPRISIVPPAVESCDWEGVFADGEDAAALAASYGLVADPWQELVLRHWLARDRDDTMLCMSCGLSVPRQNGKNAIIEMRELYGLVVMGEQILHTAHRVDTAKKSFTRLVSFFTNPRNEDLCEMVVSIRRTNGQEAITLSNGAFIEFSSRVNGSGRGASYDLVVFDEAQWLTDEQLGSIMSTLAAAPSGNRQLIYTGTPPDPGSPGTVFRRRRTDALTGQKKRLLWQEWSVESIGDKTDRDRWYETNPGLGSRLDEDYTEEECETMLPDEFARERLGWWDETAAVDKRVFRMADWRDCECLEPPDGKIAYGVKFSPDGAVVSLAASVLGSEVDPYVGLLENASTLEGIGWLVDFLVDELPRCAAIAIDGKAGARNLANMLDARKVPKGVVMLATTQDAIAAASGFLDAVCSHRVSHVDDEVLDGCVEGAVKRRIGNEGGFGFSDIKGRDVSPLEACALALWGVRRTRRNPGRKQRML